MDVMRARAAASALGSVRAEGGEPGEEVQALLEAWARGEVSTEGLAEAQRDIAAGRPLSTVVVHAAV